MLVNGQKIVGQCLNRIPPLGAPKKCAFYNPESLFFKRRVCPGSLFFLDWLGRTMLNLLPFGQEDILPLNRSLCLRFAFYGLQLCASIWLVSLSVGSKAAAL